MTVMTKRKPVTERNHSNIPDLCHLDVHSFCTPVRVTQKAPDIAKCFLEGNIASTRTTAQAIDQLKRKYGEAINQSRNNRGSEPLSLLSLKVVIRKNIE